MFLSKNGLNSRKIAGSTASIFATAALIVSVLVPAAPAHAVNPTFNCGTSGSYEVSGGVAINGTTCTGSLTLDSSVTSVGFRAFDGSAITSLVVPSTVVSIGGEAFAHIGSGTSLTLNEGLQTIGSNAFAVFGANVNNELNIVIPNSVTTLGDAAFQQVRFNSVSIGNGLTSLPSQAFYNNFGAGVKTINWGQNLSTIGLAAFIGYRGTNLIVPEGVTSIGERALEGASSLTRLYLPSTLSTLGLNVFGNPPSGSLTTLSYCGNTSAVQNYASFPGGAHPTGCFVGATYAANNGTSNTVVEDNTVGATSSVRTNTFTRTGYDFAGWTSNQDGTGASFAQGAQRVFNSHETFYAQWSLRPKVLTFDGNGATSGSMAQQSSTTSVRLNANQFARSGYTFAGWNTVRDANGGSAYADQATFGFVSDSTLYAQWTENPAPPAPAPEPAKHKVTFEISAGENVQIVSQVVEENKTVTPPTVPTREGYKFDGWKVSSLGEFVYDFSKMLITSPVTISAVWEPLTYTVAFDSGKPGAVVSKTAKYSEKLALFSKPTKAGYKFVGWRVGSASGKPFRFSYQIKKDLKLVGTWIKLKK